MEKLIITDSYNIRDAINNNLDKVLRQKRTSPFIGMVRIYENGILNTDQSKDGWLFNMTIGSGREFANQSIFKLVPPSSPPGSTTPRLGDITEYSVNAFSVGSNGSSIDSNDNITLLGPNVCDDESAAPIALNTSCFKNRSGTPYIVKKLVSDTDIFLQTSDDIEFTGCQDRYFTITKCICKVDAGEPSSLETGNVVKIDEAFLYATHPGMTHDNDSTTHKVVPFAHICFAPKFVEKESIFIIEWFIIF